MPRRSLVSRLKGGVILTGVGLGVAWGVALGGEGWAHSGQQTWPLGVPDPPAEGLRVEAFGVAEIAGVADETNVVAVQDRQIQPWPKLAQAPATPDTTPEFGEPEFGEPIPLNEPGAWLAILMFLISFVLPIILFFLPMIFLVLVVGISVWLFNLWNKKHRPKCDICGVFSTIYNAKKAKPYLNSAQQIEVDLDSVFYSVAVCPQCTRRKVFRFASPNRLVTQCPRCYYKTMEITQQTTTRRPTSKREGEAIIHRTCRHCGYTATKTEVLTPNDDGKTTDLDAFLEQDWKLGSLREGYRDPREVEPGPPDEGTTHDRDHDG